MKNLAKVLVLSLFIITSALAEFPAVRNDTGATTLIPTNGNPGPVAVDSKGQLLMGAPSTSATGLGKASITGTWASGDVGVASMAIMNEGVTDLGATALKYSPIAVNRYGALFVEIKRTLQPSNDQNSILKAEDVLSVDADAGVATYSVRNNTLTGATNADNDYQPFKSNTDGALYSQAVPGATSGLTLTGIIAAASNNSTNVKASAGQVYTVQACNTTAATLRYVKLFNKATAPTCGTDTPVYRILLPTAGCTTLDVSTGLIFSLGIGYCIVTGAADADNTAVTAADVLLNIGYK